MRSRRPDVSDVHDHPRRLMERWFTERGVPQLIAGYSTEQRIDARAVPLLGVWLVVGTVLVWLQRPGHGLPANLAAAAVALIGTILVLVAFLRLRGHPPFGPRRRLDVVDVAMTGLVPGLFAALITRDPGAGVGVVGFLMLGVAVIYVVAGLGLPELAVWGARHLRTQLVPIATLVARTLPLLLILVVFLLFAEELWQTADALGGSDLVAVVALLLVVGGILVVVRAGEEIRNLEDHLDQETVRRRIEGTPAAGLGSVARGEAPPPLRWLERVNLVVLVMVSQLVQSVFVAAMVLVFLVALGLLAVPAAIQSAWVGGPLREVAGFAFLGESRMLSGQLLTAAALLASMCGLYFTGLALTDAAYRVEFHTRVVSELEQIMAVRSVYLREPDLAPPDVAAE